MASPESIGPPDLNTLLKDGYAQSDLQGVDEFIVLIGDTGNGKSTLSQFILHDPSLIITKVPGSNYLMFIDNSDKIGSTDMLLSKTLIPNISTDPSTKTVLVDLAGFLDTRSEMDDLLAAFLNKLILDSAKRLKIVVVENYTKFIMSESRSAVRDCIGRLANLLHSNHQSFTKSICLIATKVDSSLSDEQIVEEINLSLTRTKQHLNNNLSDPSVQIEIDIIEYLLGKVAFFRRPNEAGDPWAFEPLRRNSSDIRKLIFETTQFTETIDGTFNVTVADKTLIYIKNKGIPDTEKELADNARHITNILFDKFNEILKRIPDEEVVSRCDAYIEEVSEIQTKDGVVNFATSQGVDNSLIEDFKFLVMKATFLFEVTDKDFAEFEQRLIKLNGGLQEIVDYARNESLFKRLIFAINAELEAYKVIFSRLQIQQTFNDLNPDNFKSKHLDLKNFGFSEQAAVNASNLNITEIQANDLKYLFLKELGNTSPKIIQPSDPMHNHGSYFDRYVVLSQIWDSAFPVKSCERVTIMASRKIFIDLDLSLKHTHLRIIAPVVEVVSDNKVLISLSGEDGENHPDRKAMSSTLSGVDGRPGLDGKSGFSSGIFVIFALDVINSQNLLVKSTGGNGSDGQHGGDGRDGMMKVSENLVKIAKKPKKKGWFFVEQAKKGIRAFVGDDDADVGSWELPTSGGNGGDAGCGAAAGSQNYFVKNSDAVRTIEKESMTGNNGNAGNGGKAGENKYNDVSDEAQTDLEEAASGVFGVLRRWAISTPVEEEEENEVQTGESEETGPDASDGSNGRDADEVNTPRYKYPIDGFLKSGINSYISDVESDVNCNARSREFLQYLNEFIADAE